METAGRRAVVSNYRSITEDFLARNSLRFGMSLSWFYFSALAASDLFLRTPATLQAAAKPDAAAIQKLELTYDKAVVGAKVRATAAGLPPGKMVDLQWGTVTGGWVIENYYFFRGTKYSERLCPLENFR